MLSSMSKSFGTLTLLISAISTLTTAYRPVQFVKHTGENGRADQEFSITQYYNETSQRSDLYVRMGAFRYEGSRKGWAALALGPRMEGALMFIIYGDPLAKDGPLTLSVRTADGHTPPRPLEEMKHVFDGEMPEVDVVTAKFIEYTGEFFHEKLQKKPSHLGVAEFVVRGYERWSPWPVSNTSTGQEFLWSSNFKQGFEEGDFSPERAIDMHQFGLGFGFLWVDLLNAVVPTPGFGPINDLEGHKGVSEIQTPVEPTKEELDNGNEILNGMLLSAGAAAGATAGITPENTPDQADNASPAPGSDNYASNPGSTGTDTPVDVPGPDHGSEIEQPVKNEKQWNIRSLMWHLHGFMMVFSFLVLYPFGIYMIRSPRPTAFNFHWTINALGSICAAIGATIGYINSHSISITHQYVGLAIMGALATQLLLGWRHHVTFLQTKTKTWLSTAHVWLGRVVLPMGMFNIISGLILRHYGWFTIAITAAVMLVEIAVLSIVIVKARGRSYVAGGAMGRDKAMPMTGADAEEYFQLAGDDEDEFSDDEEDDRRNGLGQVEEEEEKREQRERLARLDRV